MTQDHNAYLRMFRAYPDALSLKDLSNIFGVSTKQVSKLIHDGKIDAVVLGKECEVGVESTVVSLVGDKPRLLRPGAVTAEQLIEIFPDLVIDKSVLSEPKVGEKVASPGMKYKHYAPKTEVYIVEGNQDNFVSFVNDKKDSLALCFSEE